MSWTQFWLSEGAVVLAYCVGVWVGRNLAETHGRR
jgi:hypothetical protein